MCLIYFTDDNDDTYLPHGFLFENFTSSPIYTSFHVSCKINSNYFLKISRFLNMYFIHFSCITWWKNLPSSDNSSKATSFAHAVYRMHGATNVSLIIAHTSPQDSTSSSGLYINNRKQNQLSSETTQRIKNLITRQMIS